MVFPCSIIPAPESAHVKRTAQESFSPEAFVLRRSMPWADCGQAGLAFLYAFNHDEAIRSFRRATELDQACAMAWWGIAYANGPHINNPVVPEAREAEAYDAAQRAAVATAAESIGIPFLYRDFRPGWKQGVQESKRLGMYRQQYCGCIYSEKERFFRTAS